MDMTSIIQFAVFGYGLTIVVAIAAAFLIRGIVLLLEAMHHKKAAPEPATPVQVAVAAPPADDTERLVAAIAAAVYATLGAHRLVYIGEAAPGTPWTTTGRTIHQTSHLPRRAPKA